MKAAHRRHTTAALVQLYDETFGGKGRGRYRIRRSELRAIAGVARLDSKFVRRLADDLLDEGFILVDRDDDFIVAACTLFDNYRKVPKQLASSLKFDDQLDDDEGEDDDNVRFSSEDIQKLTHLLRGVAQRKKTTRYSEISQHFGLDMANIDDRVLFSQMLGYVSESEYEAGRGMLSSVVINEELNKPGDGYFELAEALGAFDSRRDDKDAFWTAELNRVYALYGGLKSKRSK